MALVSLDKDADSYIERAGLNRESNLNVDGLYTAEQARYYVNWLFKGFKVFDLWDDLKDDSAYLMLGGTEEMTAVNLISSNYTIDWHGGVTFDKFGVKGDGSTGYGNTNFILKDSSLTNINNGVSFFTKDKDNGVNSGAILGCFNAPSPTSIYRVETYYDSIGILGDLNMSNNSGYRGLYGDGEGFYSLNRTSLNTMNLTINNIPFQEKTAVENIPFDDNILPVYVLAQNFTNISEVNSPSSFYKKPVLFIAFHKGLTPYKTLKLNYLITQFNRSLNRI